MNPSANNTILITGGGSGIGRGLAEAFHKFGNKVIIAGRRKEVLETVTAANPGMEFAVLDVQDSTKLSTFVADITAKYPALNVLINMAGVMKPENFADSTDTATADDIISTNLTAPIHLTATLLPLLKKQPKATVMTVTSGLAFTPLAMTPTYCATKAAMHSWSVSLRYQLRHTSVEVLELAPPYVQTELMGEHQASDPRAMPLADYIAEVMSILSTQPDAKEILVKNVYPLRFAGDFNSEKFYAFFEQFNAAMAAH
ncbi:putative oxidoreductase [Granulicella aggregans]|uniref:Putative oxidoreductase n=1 Tax=Granulicella aggregans TaxID=474949 RepID=A0A7W7ZBU2_9BACT|nr:SDR family NAD(P)-dependent oxidoreductase [Granulicella aggregans]MBB5057025.1 putative oxidoreductase [Granulicella aggregans]